LVATVGEFAVGDFVGEAVMITGAGVVALVGTEVSVVALTHSTFPLIPNQLPSDTPAYWSWTVQPPGGLLSWFSKK